MKKYCVVFMVLFLICFLGNSVSAQTPKGAKALFDSGEGTTVKMSSGPRASAPAATQAAAPAKYVGISYKLVLLRPDGRFDIVPKSRVFRSGERLKLLVRTNKPGYLTILNIGTSGNTNVLFNDYIEGLSMLEIPKAGNFRFSGDPGSEKLLIMLSGSPNPLGSPRTTTVAQASGAMSPLPPPPGPTADAGNLPPPPPPPPPGATADASSLPPPPPAMLANLQGSKDIVMDDNQKTSYAVISPKNGWKPEPKGKKDIVLESSGGENYGVIPASYIDDGKILTLEINLRHK
ncbi:MAG: DUF4384 domain-containing protein [Proteobacteria bacterium]|nr:DUF4384 domain-containing protein [Pseudomonadota bacterium]